MKWHPPDMARASLTGPCSEEEVAVTANPEEVDDTRQGLILVHSSAQLKHLLCDRDCN